MTAKPNHLLNIEEVLQSLLAKGLSSTKCSCSRTSYSWSHFQHSQSHTSQDKVSHILTIISLMTLQPPLSELPTPTFTLSNLKIYDH